jgi:hypothetical protein
MNRNSSFGNSEEGLMKNKDFFEKERKKMEKLISRKVIFLNQ